MKLRSLGCVCALGGRCKHQRSVNQQSKGAAAGAARCSHHLMESSLPIRCAVPMRPLALWRRATRKPGRSIMT